jgi:hypothetical protein
MKIQQILEASGHLDNVGPAPTVGMKFEETKDAPLNDNAKDLIERLARDVCPTADVQVQLLPYTYSLRSKQIIVKIRSKEPVIRVIDITKKLKTAVENLLPGLRVIDYLPSSTLNSSSKIIFPGGFVMFNCALGGVISGISKLVECREIEFSDIHHLKPGGVLDLFRVKGLQAISPGGEWRDMVNANLPTKDILQCQEDLITNGLKEFAKF